MATTDKRNAASLLKEISDTNGDMTLSLHRVLTGTMEGLGGPDSMGRLVARMIQDDEVSMPSRVSLLTTAMKLMGQYGSEQIDSGLIDSDEQLIQKIRELEDIESAGP